ncbi:MAG: hypothetical protein E7J90_08740 [Cutibacterium avidum]|nr:hypothetical protein [Cutibacterium avidum]
MTFHFDINPAFLRKELGAGSVGEQYDRDAVNRFLAASDEELAALLEQFLDDPNSAINEALDDLAHDAVNLWAADHGIDPYPKKTTD